MDYNIFKSPLRHFIKAKINGGAVLLFVAAAAMIIANTPLRESYDAFFAKEVILQFGDINLFHVHGGNMTFMSLINDALMAIFFFSVGLEIKREILVGELSSPRKALLPVVAACGGMLVPILIFSLICPESPASRGAAIPMATDIAFSLGVLSLLGKRIPLSLKIFLTTFAVVDDIGGIIVIGAFYSSNLILEYLLWALGIIFILWIGGKAGINSKLFYIFFQGKHIIDTYEKLLVAIFAWSYMFIGAAAVSRTEEYTLVLGEILGFKEFITVTEEDKIKFMLEDNPELFYDILPYFLHIIT